MVGRGGHVQGDGGRMSGVFIDLDWVRLLEMATGDPNAALSSAIGNVDVNAVLSNAIGPITITSPIVLIVLAVFGILVAISAVTGACTACWGKVFGCCFSGCFACFAKMFRAEKEPAMEKETLMAGGQGNGDGGGVQNGLVMGNISRHLWKSAQRVALVDPRARFSGV